MMPSLKVAMRYRLRILLVLIGITPVGFYTKFYGGPGSQWVHNSLGGVLYVIFWSLAASLLFIRARPWKVAGIVTLATCFLEVLQRWDSPPLEAVRSTFLGAALLGNSFSWSDLLHYWLGFLVAWGVLAALRMDSKP